MACIRPRCKRLCWWYVYILDESQCQQPWAACIRNPENRENGRNATCFTVQIRAVNFPHSHARTVVELCITLSLKDRNVVETVRWVWEDSSLSVFIGSGTIFVISNRGWNMLRQWPCICFKCDQKVDLNCPFMSHRVWGRRSPYKINNFRSILKSFNGFWKFPTASSKTGCNMEHSRKFSKTVIYHNRFWDKHAQHETIYHRYV